MANVKEGLTIGGLADAAGVTVETVRFYQRQGLVPEPERPTGGIRRYGSAAVERLRFIKAAQRLGFTLEDVAELIHLDGAACSIARLRAKRKLKEVQAKLADLRRMEAALTEVIARCSVSKGKVRCPLLETLATGDGARA